MSDFIDHGDPAVDAAWERLFRATRRPIHGGYPTPEPSPSGTLLEQCYAIVPHRTMNEIFNIGLLAHAGRHEEADFRRRSIGYN